MLSVGACFSIPALNEEEDEPHGDAGPPAHAEGQHGTVHPSRLRCGFAGCVRRLRRNRVMPSTANKDSTTPSMTGSLNP